MGERRGNGWGKGNEEGVGCTIAAEALRVCDFPVTGVLLSIPIQKIEKSHCSLGRNLAHEKAMADGPLLDSMRDYTKHALLRSHITRFFLLS